MSSAQTTPTADDAGRPGSAAPHPVSPAISGGRRPIYVAARMVNPLMRTLAGKRHVRFFAVIEHRGRRSGRVYATPVAARRTDDGFVVPMTFGEGADWFRNVKATDGCVVKWNGVEYPLADPEIVDFATAKPAFRRVERTIIRVFGIRQFVRLRNAPVNETGSSQTRVKTASA